MQGILFKPEMIQAIEDGRKTVTSRLNGLREINKEPDKWELFVHTPDDEGRVWFSNQLVEGSNTIVVKPRYKVGEVVYIKEAHYRYGHWRETGGLTISGRVEWEFVAESDKVRYKENRPDFVLRATLRISGWYKRTPLFMPSWAARRFLTIIGVSAGRMQEIKYPDICAEGIDIYRPNLEPYLYGVLVGQFISLWDSINKDYPWESNPWCFRYEFKKGE
uniref:Uncharacterized protein n=1 Tax=viral metagenome TaxID=1070528 RepID=A0A6M3JLV5_9ZZZZ